MSSQIIRITMFKMPNKADQQKMIKNYQLLQATQEKDGKPYILSLEAGPANEDARSQGFDFVCKTIFKNQEDWDFYDVTCPAHNVLKVAAEELDIKDKITVTYTPTVVRRLE